MVEVIGLESTTAPKGELTLSLTKPVRNAIVAYDGRGASGPALISVKAVGHQQSNNQLDIIAYDATSGIVASGFGFSGGKATVIYEIADSGW